MYCNFHSLLFSQKFISTVLDDRSLSTHLNLLHMVFRPGCGVAPVGYMAGRDTTQSLGCQQGVALMALSVCFINTF